MSNEWIAADATSSFSEFVVRVTNDELGIPGGPKCLADFIQAWIEHGYGVHCSQGDFQTYTIAVLAIVDEWIKHPHVLDYVPKDEDGPIIERRVETFLGEHGFRHRALDPYYFAQCVYAQLGKERRTHPELF